MDDTVKWIFLLFLFIKSGLLLNPTMTSRCSIPSALLTHLIHLYYSHLNHCNWLNFHVVLLNNFVPYKLILQPTFNIFLNWQQINRQQGGIATSQLQGPQSDPELQLLSVCLEFLYMFSLSLWYFFSRFSLFLIANPLTWHGKIKCVKACTWCPVSLFPPYIQCTGEGLWIHHDPDQIRAVDENECIRAKKIIIIIK